MKMLFCNIGWMSWYEGDAGRPDKIVGGGSWVSDNGTGHEVCNFLACRDGNVYGHVETIHGETDRQIRIENIGASGDSAEGIDVVWTATDPGGRGRTVVGWYRNATVFRRRQEFSSPPSAQHRRDDVTSYRVVARAADVRCLPVDARGLVMKRGAGWMGRTPWWVPDVDASSEIDRFVRDVRLLINGGVTAQGGVGEDSVPAKGSSAAPENEYSKYVAAYEVTIAPRHAALQSRFEEFVLATRGVDLRANVASVDLRYHDAGRGPVLAEIKPCESGGVRFAVRTAMGQLLDYRQRAMETVSLLVVVETAPCDEDCQLALSNGFGIAYPEGDAFKVIWPAVAR